jgi:hypothetical protein
MKQVTHDDCSNDARVLLFSHRNLYEPEVWRAGYRELESVIEEVDNVDVVAPRRAKWHYQRKRNALRFGKYTSLVLNPGVKNLRLKQEYDLLFIVCEKPSDLLSVNAIEKWREHCRTAICWMTEFYEKDIPQYKSVLKVLADFDHVLFTTVGTKEFKQLLKGKVSFLPAGIDTIKFCPYPHIPNRFIDVLSIGRRADPTHQALLRMAKNDGILYMYDTIKDLSAYNVEEHRWLLANLAKRSRYFIAYPGKIDRPIETGEQSEFGQRYFEGLAAGAVLLGDRPRNNKEFDGIFDWPEAVIQVPYASENIREIIRDFEKDPIRAEKMRTHNIVESLSKHDWTHRWETVLKLAGLHPSSKLLERKQRLATLMTIVKSQPLRSGVLAG